MSEILSSNTNINKVYREDISRDIDELIEISLLMTTKGISIKKAKEIIEKSYGMIDLSKKDLQDLPKYESLSVEQKIEFKKKQRNIVASCMTAESGQDISADDDRFDSLFIPEKMLTTKVLEFSEGGFMNKMKLNIKNFYKKQELDEENSYFIHADTSGKPIFTDFKKLKNVCYTGELSRIKSSMATILTQHIQNLEPFILVRENLTEEALSNEDINKLKELYSYPMQITVLNDSIDVDLFNYEYLVHMIQGTKTFKNIEDKDKLDDILKIAYAFIEIQKSKYKFMFNKNQYFLDFMEFNKVYLKAEAHLYNFEEHMYFEISKKFGNNFKGIKETYKKIHNEFTEIAKEISDIKDNLNHVEGYNIYKMMNMELEAETHSFIFEGLNNEILKSLLYGLLNNTDFKSNIHNKIAVFIEKTTNASEVELLMREGRKINVKIFVNINELINEKGEILSYSSLSSHLFHFFNGESNSQISNAITDKRCFGNVTENDSFIMVEGLKKLVKI